MRPRPSFALEVPFSLLLAPLLFYLHTTFVLGILRGRVTPWISPSRNPGETLPLRTAVQMFWLPGLAALGLTALAWLLVPSFLVCLLAIIVGWGIAIPLATGSSLSMRIPRIWTEQMRVGPGTMSGIYGSNWPRKFFSVNSLSLKLRVGFGLPC